MRTRSLILAIAILMTLPSAAASQPADAHARAEELFRLGRQAMEGGDHERALRYLRDSQDLEPGRGKLLNMAFCEEALGRVATALGHFQAVAVMLPDDDERRALVTNSIDALKPRVPHLIIVLHKRALTSGEVLVTLDGEVLSPEALASPIAVDPGLHTIVVTGTGILTETQQDTLKEGETKRYTPQLRRISPSPPSALPGAPRSPWSSAPVPSGAPPVSKDRPTSAGLIGGIVLGGVGLVGLGVGIGYAAHAASIRSESEAYCDEFRRVTYCYPKGIELLSDSVNAGRVATAALAVGAGLLGSGTVVLIRAISRNSAQARARGGPITANFAVRPGGVSAVAQW